MYLDTCEEGLLGSWWQFGSLSLWVKMFWLQMKSFSHLLPKSPCIYNSAQIYLELFHSLSQAFGEKGENTGRTKILSEIPV